MPTITVSDAAKMYDKTRRTIQRHIATGRLTAGSLEHGKRVIDLSELIRVYGEPINPPPDLSPPTATPDDTPVSPHDTTRMDELLALVKAQGEQITALTQKIDEMQRRLPPPAPAHEPNSSEAGQSVEQAEKTPEGVSTVDTGDKKGMVRKLWGWVRP